MKEYIKLVTRISVILLTVIGIIGMLSCKKYLDEKQDKRLAVPQTLKDLQALLDNNQVMNLMGTPSLGEGSTDDYFLTTKSYNQVSDHDKRVYTWNIGDYNIQFAGDWEQNYYAVYYANYCIDQLSEIDKTAKNNDVWDNVKGSALFFRAYYFLDLAWEYAKAYDSNTSNKDLGIVLRLTSNSNVKSKRATVQETYDRIIKDAKEAASYLPDLPMHVMRPSRCAAYGLLARAYLSMRIYDSAYRYADLALRIKSDLLDYNDASEVDSNAIVPFKLFNREIIFFTNESVNNSVALPSNASIDTVLYFDYNVNDLRRSVFFFERDGYPVFKGNYNAINRYSGLFSGISTDEILLIKAECEARFGEVSKSIRDLNTLLQVRWRSTTFVPLKVADSKEALKIILKERRKELLMRGLRWIDIKRLNKEDADIILKRTVNGEKYVLMPDDNYYALPLPSDILRLTGMPQNPR